MRRHRPSSPFSLRVNETIGSLAISESELLAMTATIRSAFDPPTKATTTTPTDNLDELIGLVKAQTVQLNEVLARQAKLEERLDRLEGKAPSCITMPTLDDLTSARAAKRVQKQPPKPLSDFWYEWFADEPRPYESQP
jgi:hypothetical protein